MSRGDLHETESIEQGAATYLSADLLDFLTFH